MEKPQFDDEIGRLYHSQATKAYLADPGPTLAITPGSGTIKVGDMFTMWTPKHRTWWKRLLHRLRLIGPAPTELYEYRVISESAPWGALSRELNHAPD